jgi:hypothetical protein
MIYCCYVNHLMSIISDDILLLCEPFDVYHQWWSAAAVWTIWRPSSMMIYCCYVNHLTSIISDDILLLCEPFDVYHQWWYTAAVWTIWCISSMMIYCCCVNHLMLTPWRWLEVTAETCRRNTREETVCSSWNHKKVYVWVLFLCLLRSNSVTLKPFACSASVLYHVILSLKYGAKPAAWSCIASTLQC